MSPTASTLVYVIATWYVNFILNAMEYTIKFIFLIFCSGEIEPMTLFILGK